MILSILNNLDIQLQIIHYGKKHTFLVFLELLWMIMMNQV